MFLLQILYPINSPNFINSGYRRGVKNRSKFSHFPNVEESKEKEREEESRTINLINSMKLHIQRE